MEKDIDMAIDRYGGNDSNITVTTDIKITDEEQKIFDTLLEVANLNDLKTTIRVNGGWVRDKMLSKDSKDIDFALDDIYGAEFAAMLSKHLYPGQSDKYGIIKANSEKSKHLETATLKVHGVFIDLVNLRSEEYADDSRVPTIDIGTPLEDALRRDLTINSLFYNINEKKIEDFTGKGISDMKTGIIRTPLEPLQTFLDDPLRVLRTIRFSTRFRFKMVEDIDAAMQQPEIKEALAKKVSFERIGRETDLMLTGTNPSEAIEYFYKYRIFSHILKFPETCIELQDENMIDKLTYVSVRVCQILAFTTSAPSIINDELFKPNEHKDLQKDLYYAGILLPFKDYTFKPKKAKKGEELVISYVMYESLKQPNNDNKFVKTCLTNLDTFIYLANSKDFDVIKVGTLLKELNDCIGATFHLAIAKQFFDEQLANGESLNQEDIYPYIEKYNAFYEAIQEHKIDNAHTLQPLLNGKDIMKLYEIKGGPILKKITNEVFDWQLLNPEGTKEDLEKYLVENKDKMLS